VRQWRPLPDLGFTTLMGVRWIDWLAVIGSCVVPYNGPTSEQARCRGAALPGSVGTLRGALEERCQSGNDFQGRGARPINSQCAGGKQPQWTARQPVPPFPTGRAARTARKGSPIPLPRARTFAAGAQSRRPLITRLHHGVGLALARFNRIPCGHAVPMRTEALPARPRSVSCFLTTTDPRSPAPTPDREAESSHAAPFRTLGFCPTGQRRGCRGGR
jgi:hypothetical protein